MSRQYTVQYLLALIKAATDQTIPPAPNDGIDWSLLLELANKHNVVNVISYAIDQLETKPAHPFLDKLNDIRNGYIYLDMRQNGYYDQLLRRFEQDGICNMALKGYILQNLYPNRDMRTMSDMDVLIRAEDLERADAIMQTMGFAVRFAKEDERAYMKDGMVGVELHLNLVSDSHPAFFAYYGDGWKYARKKEGMEYTYVMSQEDYFIYHIVHLAKHYKVAGTGIRSVLDIYILLQKYDQQYDWTYIRTEFAKMGIADFAENIIHLAQMWFGDRERTPILAQMENYMLSGGVYGSIDRKHDASLIQDGKVANKNAVRIKRYFLAVFPTFKTMRGLYPILQKFPVLLPFYWIKRAIRKIFFGKKDIKRVIHTYQNVNTDNAQAMAEHLKKIGL